MNMYVDDETGYVIMDDIQEGFDILPSELYQSYLKQIKDQQEQIVALQEKVADLQDKLANIAAAQADASAIAEKNRQSYNEAMATLCQTERGIGIAIGFMCSDNAKEYGYANFYNRVFQDLYNVVDEKYPALLAEIEAKYEDLKPKN